MHFYMSESIKEYIFLLQNTPHINVFGIKAEGQRQTQNLQGIYLFN